VGWNRPPNGGPGSPTDVAFPLAPAASPARLETRGYKAAMVPLCFDAPGAHPAHVGMRGYKADHSNAVAH
jgi:hypothetical protein